MLSRKLTSTAIFSGILLSCVLGMASRSAAQAQDSAAPPSAAQPASRSVSPAPPAPARRAQSDFRRRTLDDRVKDLAKSLDLNETQQAGVKEVLERQQMEARHIQFDPTLTGPERIGRFRALQENTVLRIRALLNDEQKKKYDPLNHGSQTTGASDSYVDQWMKHHQESATPPQQPSHK